MNKSTTEDTTRIQIPRLIHFVWAGGDKLMNDDEVTIVAIWCTHNPTCTVNL